MTTPSFTFPLVDVQPTPTGLDTTQPRSAIQLLKRSFLLATAKGDSLTVLGGNYGVPRPPQTSDDEIFRRLIPVLAWQPKTIKFTTFMVLTAVFGSQADIRTAGGRPWQIYEPNANEFVLEIPLSLLVASNVNASYLHGISGYAVVPSGPANNFTVSGDLTALSATTLVGAGIQVFYSGVWNSYTIVSATYSSGPNTTQIVVSATTLPAGGGLFVIEIPGDNISSYMGDYLANGEFQGSFFVTSGGPPTNTILVVGDATSFIRIGDTITLQFTDHSATYTVVSFSAYNLVSNRTQIVVDRTDITTGTSGHIIRSLESADGIATPSTAFRVYFTGLGLVEIVTFYLNLLVRAAGIVMRIELI